MRRALCVLLLLLLAPLSVNAAWWNGDWKFRKKITINTSEQGVPIQSPVGTIAVPVRLHTGNFLFADAKPDGSDIRFVAGDDKTPLKHHIELFDSVNQLAILWVQVPQVAPGAASAFIWMYSGNENAPPGEDAKGTFDGNQILVIHGPGKDGKTLSDTSAFANTLEASRVEVTNTGLLGGAIRFKGEPLTVTPVPSARVAANGGVSFSAWVKAESDSGQLIAWGPFVVELSAGSVRARLGATQAAGGTVAAGQWTHVAVSAGKTLAIHVNGVEVGSQAVQVPEITGTLTIGAGFTGELDEITLANVARSADWIRLDAAQGMDGKLVSYGEAESTEGGPSQASYFKILVDNLTIDAWVVIIILFIMMLISFTIMFFKAAFVGRATKANEAFLDQFDKLGLEIVKTQSTAKGFDVALAVQPSALMERYSSLFHMYKTAVTELGSRSRVQGEAIKRNGISEQTLQSIRASVDAVLVRERQRLDSRLVMLTIAISGGPFLGLLGTVVGVMIVFAAVAAAGDVNINAIAPGIAAALLATVAGLGVAIPCLFGYNYLASRVKAITADMQVFADVIVTRLAERFAPQSGDTTPVRMLEAAE